MLLIDIHRFLQVIRRLPVFSQSFLQLYLLRPLFLVDKIHISAAGVAHEPQIGHLLPEGFLLLCLVLLEQLADGTNKHRLIRKFKFETVEFNQLHCSAPCCGS